MRVSNPVRSSISRSSSTAIPPRRAWPKASVFAPAVVMPLPSRGVAPSETTTIENVVPRAWRRLMRSQTSSMSNGRSGTRITSAPPAMPL